MNHFPGCYGCGIGNARGLTLEVRWDGTTAVCEVVPLQWAQGAPGLAHGGYLAALVDEVAALVATEVAGRPAMTVESTIRYRSPARIGTRLTLEGKLQDRSGETLIIDTTAVDAATQTRLFSARTTLRAIDVARMVENLDPNAVSAALHASSGDKTQYFHLMNRAWQGFFAPTRMTKPIHAAVTLSDVSPSRWTYLADGNGLEVQEGHFGTPVVSYQGPLAVWQDLVAGRAPADALASGLDGDLELFIRWVKAFD